MSAIIQKVVEAKKLFQQIVKNRNGYNYKYADLDEIVSKTNDGLLSQGLSIHTTTEAVQIGEKPMLIVTAHLSDGMETITASVPMPLDGVWKAKVPAQDMGSILTYGRRYAYCALLNLTADEDIDAAPEPRKEQRPANDPKPISNIKPPEKTDDAKLKADQIALIRNEVVAHGQDAVMKVLQIQSLSVVNSWNLATLRDAAKFLSENLAAKS